MNKLPESSYDNLEFILKFIREHSRYHNLIFSLEKCGEGGESLILSGDIPGENVVFKLPRKIKDAKSAMEETHIIEFLYDWMGYDEFIVKPREELIVR